jgi:ribonuclease PH
MNGIVSALQLAGIQMHCNAISLAIVNTTKIAPNRREELESNNLMLLTVDPNASLERMLAFKVYGDFELEMLGDQDLMKLIDESAVDLRKEMR